MCRTFHPNNLQIDQKVDVETDNKKKEKQLIFHRKIPSERLILIRDNSEEMHYFQTNEIVKYLSSRLTQQNYLYMKNFINEKRYDICNCLYSSQEQPTDHF